LHEQFLFENNDLIIEMAKNMIIMARMFSTWI